MSSMSELLGCICLIWLVKFVMLMTQMLQELVSACQQLAAEKEGYEKDVTTHEDIWRP